MVNASSTFGFLLGAHQVRARERMLRGDISDSRALDVQRVRQLIEGCDSTPLRLKLIVIIEWLHAKLNFDAMPVDAIRGNESLQQIKEMLEPHGATEAHIESLIRLCTRRHATFDQIFRNDDALPRHVAEIQGDLCAQAHEAGELFRMEGLPFIRDSGQRCVAEVWKGISGRVLLAAAERRQRGLVDALLACGVDINVADARRRSPLHIAIGAGQEWLADMLLERGPDISVTDERGWSLLHEAANAGSATLVEKLCRRGALVDAMAVDSKTPLHLAAAKPDSHDIVENLLGRGASVVSEDFQGRTPLHVAAINGNAEVAKSLIRYGADPRARNVSRLSPLHLAVMGGSVETVEVLIDNVSACKLDVDQRDAKGDTPLHKAALMGHSSVAMALLQRGAIIYNKNMAGQTPVAVAERANHADTAAMLRHCWHNALSRETIFAISYCKELRAIWRENDREIEAHLHKAGFGPKAITEAMNSKYALPFTS